MRTYVVLVALVACLGVAHAQITLPGGTVLFGQGICTAKACFANQEAKRKYEQDNNCKFPAENLCGDKPMDKATQCCGKDAMTGSAKIKERQLTKFDADFNWATYQKECSNMKQSEAKPDKFWSQCEVGKKHNPDDDYAVVTVEKNGNARTYCIDGCSTPPGAVGLLYRKGSFIFRDKDNPTGAGPGGFGPDSSFYGSCAAHDKCYQTCNGSDQKNCDDRLLAEMLTVCRRIPENHETTFTNNLGFQDTENTRDKCISAANDMHTGLRAPVEAARKAFKTRRQQYCQCC